ncbi:DUF302 domain-containing protein [Pistricoccus aurantiacus]|uniref:DUF302 domain-containing protein n=2 Tax=Pistricoccus aurantiacus TaxID=1883414 RepID=A0A5B8SY60_9GAMM|nr:DUF302 domain-containing protein [Pistricoccus aurantiacus]
MLTLGAVAQADSHGIEQLQTDATVEEAAERLREALDEKGLRLFAVVDHTSNAESVEMQLPLTQTFIFGNPKAGTPLMQCDSSVALDLPQKMVIRQVQEGEKQTLIEWNSPQYLAERHGLEACDLPLDKIEGVLQSLAEAAAGNS